jgi:two-component system response regulator AtoC
VFLDEIGEMPLPLQAKLLQVLQDGVFSRLGSGRDIRVDVRVIASTNKELERAVREGAFREDLYYRLNVVNIHVPPLRERREEIPILVEQFWQKYSKQYNRQRGRISRALLERFMAHPWPGNVRELENMVKRIVVLESEEFVKRELVGREAGAAGREDTGKPRKESGGEGPKRAALGEDGLGLKEIARRAAREAERGVMREVLDQVHWNRVEAARRLKISYKALLYKIQECGL